MKNKIFKIKKGLAYGFTLVETLVAVLILSISIGALLSLASGGFYSERYSRNQIVANNLLQESIEYIRNTRDSAIEQGGTWNGWQSSVLSVDVSGNPAGNTTSGCFSNFGCYVDPYTTDPKIKQCNGTCPYVQYYPDNSFYGYIASYNFPIGTSPYQTSFIRKIRIAPSSQSADQLIVTATITWENGSDLKNLSQTTLITNWKK